MSTPKSIVNRKAKFEYTFVDTYEAGIILAGAEVKSLRAGNANLTDAYCFFRKGELYIKGFYIAEYKMAHHFLPDPRQERKLLLNKRELQKLEKKAKEKGFTMIPYKVYFNDRGLVKIEVVLAQGKKMHDKRQSIKEKDTRRELDRIKKTRL
ncbi:MAG: SsrA-binding protein SmpB [Saprospiraceae bacterium]|nr:SsrA-binding protein SmpB [Saprospiraceae bacterium]